MDSRVPHPNGWRRAAVPAAWCMALASLPFLRGLATGADWLPWAAAITALAAYGIGARALTSGVPIALRHRLAFALALIGAPLFVLAAASGGSASPAALAAGPIVLGIAWRSGLTRGAMAAGAAVLLLLIADLALFSAVDVPHLLVAGTTTVAIGLAPLWYGRRIAATGIEARRRLARVEGYLAERRMTPHGSRAIGTDLRRDAQLVQQHAEGLTYLAELDRYLRDVRDSLGAEEAILWRLNEGRGTQIPLAWSTAEADAPRHFRYEEWAPLVKWSAESGLVHCFAPEQTARFVAAPIERSGRLYGVLSVSAAQGLEVPQDRAKEWVARYAEHAALLSELFEIRREYAKQSHHAVALHRASERIRPNVKLAEVGRAICEAALEITSGSRVALVRWDAASDGGCVEAVSPGHPVREQLAVAGDALVPAQCRTGEDLLKQDAYHLVRRRPVFGAGEARREVGCLAIVPMVREAETFGALVVESEAPEAITSGEVRNLRLLAAIAATALQVSWEIEQVDRRARTDELTGLGNRRQFDEELERLLELSDRHGQPTALIVADIDHFKHINDTHGHDAGDAVLQHVAQVFVEVARAIDLCARYGGEEIAVLLPQTTLTGAGELAERLRRALELRPAAFGGKDIPVTCSIGVAAYPQCTTNREGLFSAADLALYEAKSDGRNRVKSAPDIRASQQVVRATGDHVVGRGGIDPRVRSG